MKRLVLLALVLIGMAEAALAAPPYPGKISLDTVAAAPGDKFSIGVHLTGSATNLAGLTIPLHFNSSKLTVDSVSYAGTILPGGIEALESIDNGTHKVKLLFVANHDSIPLQSIPASGGLLARIYVSLSPTAIPETIKLDTVYIRDSVVMPDSSVIYIETETLNAADPQATSTLYPDFVPGAVLVQVPTGTGDEDRPGLPLTFSLGQNYPNPFNPTTQISFTLGKRSKVELEVFNVLGQRVATLVNEVLPAGEHAVTFDATHQPSGIYFYRLTHSEGSETKKMVFLK